MFDDMLKFSWGYINLNVFNFECLIVFYSKFGFEVFILVIFYLGMIVDVGYDFLLVGLLMVFGVFSGMIGCVCIM